MKWFSKKRTNSLGDQPVDNPLLTDFLHHEAVKYPGGEFLELVAKEAYEHLGDQPIDDLYGASLVGGHLGAELVLAHDERCLELWQNGDLRKATRLIEVWASTVLLILLQRQEDQDMVLRNTASGFAMLFRSDENNLKTELLAYREARKAEQARRGEKGLRAFSKDILYLRTLRALGDKGVPNFELLLVPWGTLREVMEAKPNLVPLDLDIMIFTNMTNGWFVPEILIKSLDAAQKECGQSRA